MREREEKRRDREEHGNAQSEEGGWDGVGGKKEIERGREREIKQERGRE